MFKPHRGVQKPAFRPEGISHFTLIKVLRFAQQRCAQAGEEESAFRFEMMAEYFEKDYVPGKPVKMDGMMLGF